MQPYPPLVPPPPGPTIYQPLQPSNPVQGTPSSYYAGAPGGNHGNFRRRRNTTRRRAHRARRHTRRANRR